MADPKKPTEPTAPEPATEPVPAPEPSINAQAKDLPWVQELMRKAKEGDELKAAAEQARKEAEIKDLESKGKYEEAIKARETEVERLRTEHAAELQKRDLTTELLKAGFTNDLLLAGAVAKYNPENGTISEYVEGLAKDEANASLLGSSVSTREPKAPPAPVGSGKEIDWAQIKELEKSANREERQKARGVLSEYRKKHGKYPY